MLHNVYIMLNSLSPSQTQQIETLRFQYQPNLHPQFLSNHLFYINHLLKQKRLICHCSGNIEK